jgi:hypothetical protein
VKSVMNLRVPQNEVNFLSSWRPVIFYGRTLLHRVSQSGSQSVSQSVHWQAVTNVMEKRSASISTVKQPKHRPSCSRMLNYICKSHNTLETEKPTTAVWRSKFTSGPRSWCFCWLLYSPSRQIPTTITESERFRPRPFKLTTHYTSRAD